MAEDRCDLLCLDLPRAEELRTSQPDLAGLDLAARRLRVLADPTRLRVADALRRGDELCVCDLAWILGRSQNLVSHHLRALREEGLAQSRRDGKVVFYSLTEAGRDLYDRAVAAVRPEQASTTAATA